MSPRSHPTVAARAATYPENVSLDLIYMSYYFKNPKTGFTLVELLIGVVMLAMVFAVGLPYYNSIYLDQNFNNSLVEITDALRQTQNRARFGYHDSAWGIYFDTINNKYLIFKGSSYASRDVAYDQAEFLPSNIFFSNIDFSGGTEAVFSQPNGDLAADANSLRVNTNSRSKVIAINKMGMINY